MSKEEFTIKDVKRARKIFDTYIQDNYKYFDKLASHRLGKVLTVIDGAVADATQRKAVKDLVHDSWYSSTSIEFSNGAPRLIQALEAIGFELYSTDDLPQAIPMPEITYNPYTEIN